MPETLAPIKPSLSFTKLVATPTSTAWAQAYNAGNLFACLSLTTETQPDQLSLQSLGKESLGMLETEFFTLEEKTTETIKQALVTCLSKIPTDVNASVTVAYYKDDLLTVFVAGGGKAILKRADTIGTLLERNTPYEDGVITSASGYLKHNDTVVVESGEFAKGISAETVKHALDLDLPNDIVEALSPQVHELDNGAQAAIVIRYHSSAQPIISEDLAEPEDTTLSSLYAPEETHSHHVQDAEKKPSDGYEEEEEAPVRTKRSLPQFKLPKLPHIDMRLGHKRKFYLTIAIIIFVLLLASIMMYFKKQSDAKQHTAFQAIYTPAQQYYEEAQGLESLNKPLSQEDYRKAEAKLKEANGKISPNSPEGKQIADLLAQVEKGLNAGPADDSSSTKSVTAPAHSLLAVEKENTDGLGFGQDENNIYVVTDSAISSISKGTGAKKELIKNNDDWTSPVAVVPYQGYMYVLDQKNGVLKFVGTNKNTYLAKGAPDMAHSSGMAIDGSIWIVTTDGKILKFTKGTQDTFGITGIDKPLNKPTKIMTTIDMDYVYVLDNGNSRIVKLDKKGLVQKIYSTSYAKNAKDFDIQDAQKQFLLYTGDKTYTLPM